MPDQPLNQIQKWRPFRWIPILFVVSLLISMFVFFFLDEGSVGSKLSPDMLLSHVPMLTDRLIQGIPKALVVSLLITGLACTVFVAIKRSRHDTDKE